MKQEFIEVETCEEATERAPWACEIIPVEGGYMVFESADDAERWKSQQ